MRISSSTVAMASTRHYEADTQAMQTTISRRYGSDSVKQTGVSQTSIRSSQFRVEGGTSVFNASAGSGLVLTSQREDNYKDLESTQETEHGQNAANQQAVTLKAAPARDWLSAVFGEINSDPKIQMLKKALEILERFTNRRRFSTGWRNIPLTQSNAFRFSASSVSLRYQQVMATAEGTLSAPVARSSNANGYWTRQTVASGFVEGEEHTAFSSTGTAVTADGRTIDFNMTVEMSRSFAAAFEVVGKEEVYTDPLVINLDTDAVALSDASFYFDLNCDGTAEKLSALDPSSGFLALDKNGDSEINDGSELFGVKTGDGFAELAQYDQDGNGWIDENDDVFSHLSVWVKSGGEAKLLSLAEADVGAIFLGSQSTQYTLANSSGEENAIIRRTGLYLKESGQVGSVQHVDFKT